MTLEMKSNYFVELALRLNRDSFSTLPLENGSLEISQNGQRLCWVDSSGYVRYQSEELANHQIESIHNKITPEAQLTEEYMTLYEKAPALEISGLDETYRALADFNGVVLAAHRNRYGMQFVTWNWGYKREGLYHGHYAAHHYEEAKQDFAIRSGLIERHHVFSDEQLTEVYRCIHKTLEHSYPITAEREKLLRKAAEQIEYAVSDLEERVSQSNLQEMELGGDHDVESIDMIQQF